MSQTISTEKAHSKLGASIAKRWLNCPGSVALIEQGPPPRESIYAQEGTMAHEALEKKIKAHLLREEADLSAYPDEMLEHVNFAYDYVTKRHQELPDSILLVEEKISLEHIEPGMFGTADISIVEEFGKLIVLDYKHGAGVAVDIVNSDGTENEQACFYALGIAKKYDYNFTDVEIGIIQPRAHHEAGVIRTHTMTMDRLLEWEKTFKDGVKKTKKKNAPVVAGNWCKFCSAAVICPAITSKALAQAQIDFDPVIPESVISLISPRDLAPARISTILQSADALESWISEVRAYSMDFLIRGGKVPGYKLVDKRSTRKWADAKMTEFDALELFGNKAFKHELLSPAQMDKIAGKDWVKDRTVSISSGVTLAEDSDSRQAINQLELDFGNDHKGGD